MSNRPPLRFACSSLGVAVLLATGFCFAQGAAPPPQAPPTAQPYTPAPIAPSPDGTLTPAPPGPPVPLADSLTGMAKAEYGAARILYEDGDFQGALQKLRSAFDLSKDPRLLWNMAAAEKNLRHYAEVFRLIDRYINEGGALVTPDDRAAATQLLDTVKGFVTDLTVEVNEPGATVYVDDLVFGQTPLAGPLRVDMGVRKIRVTKPGFVEYAVSQDLPGGQTARVTVQLVQERHEGKLRILAGPQDVIQVDGRAVGTGLWEGVLPSGTHALYVSARGKRPHQTDVVVQDNDVTTVHVALQDDQKQTIIIEKGGVPTWVWIAGGAVLVGGGVGAYFLLRDNGTQYRPATEGSWGAVSL
jgi:PEGA domain